MMRRLDWILQTLFPSTPDDLMAVAEAAGVTPDHDDGVDLDEPVPYVPVDEAKARARAAAAKRAQSPANQRTPAPWFVQERPVEPIHPALRVALSDDNLRSVVEEWSS